MAKTKYIAPRSLGSQSHTSWTRKNYNIDHAVDDCDYDSRYEGTFYGHKFVVSVCGIDGGSYLGIAVSSPKLSTVIEGLRNPDIELTDEEYAASGDGFYNPASDMPEAMKQELATALLVHHEAAYDRWVREEREY